MINFLKKLFCRKHQAASSVFYCRVNDKLVRLDDGRMVWLPAFSPTEDTAVQVVAPGNCLVPGDSQVDGHSLVCGSASVVTGNAAAFTDGRVETPSKK